MQHPRRFDTGQTGIEALEFVGKALMVDAAKMEHGGVEIADVDRARQSTQHPANATPAIMQADLIGALWVQQVCSEECGPVELLKR